MAMVAVQGSSGVVQMLEAVRCHETNLRGFLQEVYLQRQVRLLGREER